MRSTTTNKTGACGRGRRKILPTYRVALGLIVLGAGFIASSAVTSSNAAGGVDTASDRVFCKRERRCSSERGAQREQLVSS